MKGAPGLFGPEQKSPEKAKDVQIDQLYRHIGQLKEWVSATRGQTLSGGGGISQRQVKWSGLFAINDTPGYQRRY